MRYTHIFDTMKEHDDAYRGGSGSGTFVKNIAALWNVTGDNGVPTGWTVQTATS